MRLHAHEWVQGSISKHIWSIHLVLQQNNCSLLRPNNNNNIQWCLLLAIIHLTCDDGDGVLRGWCAILYTLNIKLVHCCCCCCCCARWRRWSPHNVMPEGDEWSSWIAQEWNGVLVDRDHIMFNAIACTWQSFIILCDVWFQNAGYESMVKQKISDLRFA